MSDLIPFEMIDASLSAEHVRTQSREAVQGVGFITLADLSERAGLGEWMHEHEAHVYGIRRKVAESFKTPIPSPEVSGWRRNSGYRYGDYMPSATWALEIQEGSRSLPLRAWGKSDTGVRILIGIPKKGDKAILNEPDHPSLALNLIVRGQAVHRVEGVIGADQLVHGEHIDTRPVQELLLVAARFTVLAAEKGEEGLKAYQPRRPSRLKLLRGKANWTP